MGKRNRTLAGLAAVGLAGALAGCKPVGLGAISLPSAPASGSAGPTAQGTATPSASASPTGQGTMGGDMGGMPGGSGSPGGGSYVQAGSYTFQTVGDNADPTFNQLLGIDNLGIIAGYFGSGAQGHPNRGFRVVGGARSFVGENFPGSVQTQVTGLNSRSTNVGFFSTMNNANGANDNTGFYDHAGSFHRVAFPTTDNAKPPVNQLLGVNDSNVAVGFYTDAAGNNHGYEYNIDRHSFHTVTIPGATSTTAAAIDDGGDVAGFFTGANGGTQGFLLNEGGKPTTLSYPGASMTQALGVNAHREVVGLYQVGSGNSAQTHGFTWTSAGGFKQVDDPAGAGTTTVNGVNDAGDLVGFYVDGNGNTLGMIATPAAGLGTSTRHLKLQAMPTGTVTLSQNSDGTLTARLSVLGLTPGSAHTVEIDTPGQDSPAAVFGTALTADATGAAKAALTSPSPVSTLPYDSRLVIRLGQTAAGSSALAAESVACTEQLRLSHEARSYDLSAVDVKTDGTSAGQLSGRATVTYDSAAKTLTVKVTASGLTPGAHAAHIHSGSCQSQGGVLYMLPDFQADAQGNVNGQTRVASGVSSIPATGAWYLNLHLGDSNTIVANGAPTLSFRPLLCANG